MGRIKIDDLPENHKVSKEEMRKVFGGMDPDPVTYPIPYSRYQPQFSYGFFTSPILLRGDLPGPLP